MVVREEFQEQVRRIVGATQCPHESPCYHRDFEGLCRVERVGSTGLLECLGEYGPYCPLGLPFGQAIFCRCPLRKYLHEHLHL